MHGRGLDAAFVEQENAFACQGISPDRTILLTTGGSARTGLSRATHRGADRLERAGEEFHTRVNEGFLDIGRAHADRVRVVQSAARKSRTSELVFRELADLFPWMADVVDDPSYFAPLDVRRPRPQGARGGSGHRGGSSGNNRGSGGTRNGAEGGAKGKGGNRGNPGAKAGRNGGGRARQGKPSQGLDGGAPRGKGQGR